MTRTHKGLGPKKTAGALITSKPSEHHTTTLRGLGHIRQTLRGLGDCGQAIQADIECPACAVKADHVSADLAACAGLALMMVRGADAVRPTLCTMHARLFRLLTVEVEQGPKRIGTDGSSWED